MSKCQEDHMHVWWGWSCMYLTCWYDKTSDDSLILCAERFIYLIISCEHASNLIELLDYMRNMIIWIVSTLYTSFYAIIAENMAFTKSSYWSIYLNIVFTVSYINWLHDSIHLKLNTIWLLKCTDLSHIRYLLVYA